MRGICQLWVQNSVVAIVKYYDNLRSLVSPRNRDITALKALKNFRFIFPRAFFFSFMTNMTNIVIKKVIKVLFQMLE